MTVRCLKKTYGNFNALSGVSFNIGRGEVFGYLGPNGAGKSTTLKILTFASGPTSGDVEYMQKSIFSSAEGAGRYKSSLGYVPEQPFLYDMLTGREFLNFICDLRRIPVDKRDHVDRYLENFEISAQADNLISGYCGGMKKKLSIISAIVHFPDIVLLDEPTNSLDAVSVKNFKSIITDLKKCGAAILLTTHVLEIAEKLCDRIAIINHGNVVAEGDMKELREISNRQGSELEDVFLSLTNKAGTEL